MKNLAVFSLCFLLLASAYGASLPNVATVKPKAHEVSQQEVDDAVRDIKSMISKVFSEDLGSPVNEEEEIVAELPCKIVDSLPAARSKRQTPPRCDDLIFQIACGAACVAERRGRGFCNNGKCGCK